MQESYRLVAQGSPRALVGVYGVVSWTATRRTLEIGIRMALGAPRLEVLALVIRHGLRVGICRGRP